MREEGMQELIEIFKNHKYVKDIEYILEDINTVQDLIDNKFYDKELVKEEATFVDDLSADSLDIVELIMSVEEEFDMEVPDADAEKIVTVGDIIDYIIEHK